MIQIDCTLDAGHIEQTTLIIQLVILVNKAVTVNAHFLCFLHAIDITDLGLFDLLIIILNKFDLRIEDCRRQGNYGFNKKGKKVVFKHLCCN